MISKVKLNPGFILKGIFTLFIAGTAGFAIAITVLLLVFSKKLPNIIDPKDYRPAVVTRILADGGKEDALIGEFFKERRYVVPYDKIPQVVVQAFTSAEDDKFFEHQGVNLFAIARAAFANFRAGHTVQGGSTITQQVAKSLLLTPERSMSRKIKEVILAHELETHLTKQQILYLYLNQIYLGHGAYGVQAAAQTYFRKDVSQLDASEAAILAGLPQAPGKYSPNLNPKKAKDRQLYVLRRMMENKHITSGQMADAAAKPVRIFHDEDLNLKYAPYLVEHIRRYLIEKFGEEAIYEQGLVVRVPIAKRLMLVSHKSVQEGLRAVDKRQGFRGAIKKLATLEEIEPFLKDQRHELLEKKLGFLLLMPDGHLDLNEAMKEAGIKTDYELLNEDDLYSAVVMNVDDAKKKVGVLVGSVKGEIPFDGLKWAFSSGGGISRALSRGSVINVKLAAQSKIDKPIFLLEQVPQVQAALFSLDATTGAVLAMEGGYDYATSEFNRAVQALRQPGSSFKPFIYAAALEKGFTPTSIIVDSPIVYDDKESGKWKPSNFEEKFYGDTTFRQALIKSRNIPTIKILQTVQVPYVIDYAKRLGLDAQYPVDLSIALGSATVSLAKLTQAYSLFPRLGTRLEPIYYTSITDRDGKVLEKIDLQALDPTRLNQATPTAEVASVPAAKPSTEGSPQPAASVAASNILYQADDKNPLDPRVAYVMTHLMKEVVSFGTGHDAKALGRSVAGKTGTTNDYLDAWFMAFTPQVVTGVWVGYDNQKSIGRLETGARAALPIWLSFMKEAVKDYPDTDFTVPPGVTFQSIDPASGKLAPAGASYAIKEVFVEGTEPKEMSEGKGSSARSQSEFLKEDIE